MAQKSWLLSLFLPGLGQLYLGKIGGAMAFFGLFLVLSHFSVTRYYLPLLAGLSGLNALKLSENTSESFYKRGGFRAYAFTAVGVVGFIGWCFIFASQLIGSLPPIALVTKANNLAKKIIQCQSRLGRLPLTVQECTSEIAKNDVTTDVWNEAFVFHVIGSRFEIRSKGKDKIEGTDDDHTYRYGH